MAAAQKPTWDGCGTGGGGDGEWRLGADLDLPAKVRQLWEAYDAPAEVVARPGWEGRSGGAQGRVREQRRRMGMGTGEAAAEALATGRGRRVAAGGAA